MRGILVATHAGAAVGGHLQRDALEEPAIVVCEGRGPVGVDVDLSDDAALLRDRDDDLGPGRREACEVARVAVHVVHDLGLATCRRGAADALADGNANVLGRLRPLPRAEHEVVAVDEVDPDPRVVVDVIVEDVDDVLQDLRVGAPAVEDPVDRLPRAGHRSRSSPSKPAIWSPYQPGISQARRSSRSTSTSVCVAVTISTSSSARYAAHS